ncbi:MAG TPA: hypothetical protein VGM34_00815 [Chlamydiales bacterium]
MSASIHSPLPSQTASAPTFMITSNALETLEGLAFFTGGLGFVPTGLLSLAGAINPLFTLIPLLVGISGAACHLLAKQMLFKEGYQLMESAQADLNAENMTSAKRAIELLEFFLRNVRPEILNENEYQELNKKLIFLNTTYETKRARTSLERSEALISAEADRYTLAQKQKADTAVKRATELKEAIKRSEQQAAEIDVDDLLKQMKAVVTEQKRTQNNLKAQTQVEAADQQKRKAKSQQIQASVEADSGPDFQTRYKRFDAPLEAESTKPKAVQAAEIATSVPPAPKKAAVTKTTAPKPKARPEAQVPNLSVAQEIFSFVTDVARTFISH